MKDLEASNHHETTTFRQAEEHDRQEDQRPSSSSAVLFVLLGLCLLVASLGCNSYNLQWHIKPFKPHHHGQVEFLTEATADGSIIYKRIITAPCGYGMLIFNIGPAAQYEPFAYDIYEDAYAYSNNGGLCVLYPSYKGIQKSDTILWEKDDPTQRTVDLGDAPNKISTRVVRPANTKNNTKRGGDFLIIRSGNFYSPEYYKHVKDLVHNMPAHANLETEVLNIIEAVDAMVEA